MRIVLSALLGSCMCSAVGASGVPRFSTAACVLDSLGLSLSNANYYADAILGEALGETFYTPDTLLESVTVWRLIPRDYTPMTFWLTSADSTDPSVATIRSGPTLVVYNPDSTANPQPTPILYTFDPPIALPKPGLYTVWVQCACAGDLFLVIDTNDLTGQFWRSARSNFSGCILAGATLLPAHLAFSAVFCRTGVVPTLRSTWGQLKAMYR
jgi:hypothetical protein